MKEQLRDIVEEPRQLFFHEGTHDDVNIVSKFLLNTVIEQPRWSSRNGVEYRTICRWRKSIKNEQMIAMKAVKKYGSSHFETNIAEQFVSVSSGLFGKGWVGGLAYVPCGHSGCNCLTSRIAELVSRKLDIPLFHAFESLNVSGSSHPKTNKNRPSMTLIEKPEIPVLLIDDVVTSGSHIEEATRLLRKFSPYVLPLVWIGQ